MSSSRPVILLTGFGPFPRVPVNATSVLVPKLAAAASRSFPDLVIVTEILPTEWTAGLHRIEQIYADRKPLLALHFGVSHKATGFAIETRARNRCALALDGAGALPANECISPNAPEYLPAKLPAALIVERLRRRGLPAQLSRDAGNYLCNALLFRTLECCRRDGLPQQVGFVHLPASLVDPRRPERPPRFGWLSWDGVIDGGLEIISTCLGRTPRRNTLSPARLSPFPSAWADA
jgi:pyroglutamyl-peptidase